MTEAEALAALRKEKPERNYVAFRVDYQNSLLVPAAAAMKIIEGLTEAWLLHDEYGRSLSLRAFDHETENILTMRIVSAEVFQQMRVAQLLGIDYEDYRRTKQTQSS